ncbi:OprD family outer membrane porin, partial [Acidithiobacillus ferriphilus]|uniref:OprD family outer membrane porin n=1 Tax=Acidithiobacillus ferriphilus TaxID=1689834 RepID=UPI002DBEBED4
MPKEEVVVFTKNRIAIAVVAALCGVSAAAQAETLTDFFKQSKIDGQIRSYYFSRDYGAAGPNQNAFSLGGILNVQTAPFLGGFGVGVSFYTANALGANNLSGAPAYPYVDSTLMGPRQSINALGQAYIQYALPKVLLVRAGDQVINTPWVNNSDSRLLPATYQGVFAEVSPYSDWHIYGMRIFRWKSRTSSGYYRDNLYDPATFDGDSMYGGSGTPVITGSSPATNGVLAFGTSGSLMGAKAQVWYYDYYQFAKTVYGDVNYTLKTGTGLDPFVGAQFNRQWQNNGLLDGSNINNSPITATSVNSTAWGAQVGLNYAAFNNVLGNGQLTW